jgi:hypothetical protein
MMVMSHFSDHEKGKQKMNDTDSDLQLPWVEKYRPGALDQVVSQPDIITTSTLCLSNPSQKVCQGQATPSFTFIWASWHWKNIDSQCPVH